MSKPPTVTDVTAALKQQVVRELKELRVAERLRLRETVKKEKLRIREEAKKFPKRVKVRQSYSERMRNSGIKKPTRDVLFAYKAEINKKVEDDFIPAVDVMLAGIELNVINEVMKRLGGKKFFDVVTLIPCKCCNDLPPPAPSVLPEIAAALLAYPTPPKEPPEPEEPKP